MNNKTKLRVASVIFLFLILAVPLVSQTETAKPSTALLEVSHLDCRPACFLFTERVYADGRYTLEGQTVEKAMSGRYRTISVKIEKQLEPDELAMLTGLAEQSDFLNAQPEYVVTTVTDQPDWYIITYRHQGRDKKVKISNYDRGNDDERKKVPSSVVKLMLWSVDNSF